jgi:hypothetical protein
VTATWRTPRPFRSSKCRMVASSSSSYPADMALG